jgi:hypothetical protein
MKRHDLDPISLLAGLLFVGLGAIFTLEAAGRITLDLLVVPAVVFITLGLAICASVVTAMREPRPEPATVEVDGADSERSDLSAG